MRDNTGSNPVGDATNTPVQGRYTPLPSHILFQGYFTWGRPDIVKQDPKTPLPGF
jgi:hypothetical protein